MINGKNNKPCSETTNKVVVTVSDLDAVTIPDFSSNDPKQVGKYVEFLKSLDASTDLWEKGMGQKTWIQGTILLRAKPIKKGVKGMGRGALKIFIDAIGMDDSTAYWRRRIADAFTREQARKIGYTAMVCQLRSAEKKDKTKGGRTTGAAGGGGKGRNVKVVVDENDIESRVDAIKVAASDLWKDLQSFHHAIEDKEALAKIEDARKNVKCARADLQRIDGALADLWKQVHKVQGQKMRKTG